MRLDGGQASNQKPCREKTNHAYGNAERTPMSLPESEFTNLVTPIIRGGSTEALKAWYDEYVFGVNSFEEYLAKLPSAELLKAQLAERENYEAFA